MLRTIPQALLALLTLPPLILINPALAHAEAAPTTQTRTLCVFDPGGGNGNVFQLIRDFAVESVAHGVKFDLKPYTDEATAASDLKSGQCDAALLTGTRVREFQPFTSTLEALGGLPDYGVTQTVIRSLAKPAAAQLMVQGDYETAGLFPGGSVFLFVRDRSVDTVGELAGKKIATLTYDKAARTMVERVGASVVPADISNFAGMFNNGSADGCYAPAYAYKALELYKGIGTRGGMIRYPIAQLTMQFVIRRDRFPAGYGKSTRQIAVKYFDTALTLSRDSERDIPAKAWIDIPRTDTARYDELLGTVRTALTSDPYDPTMLTLLEKARCKSDGTRAECAALTRR